MLVRRAPDQLDMNRAELDALLERQLVMLEDGAAGRRRAYLTEKGRSFLDALHPDGQTPRRGERRAAPREADASGLPSRLSSRLSSLQARHAEERTARL